MSRFNGKGVSPMGRNYFVLAGHDSRDFGVYISGQGTFSAPQKDLDFIPVPGRNGELLSDQKRFENLELTYRAFIYKDFDTSIAAFRAFLLSLSGYQRLTDSYHPDEIRMVAYQGAFEPTVTKKNDAGSFDIKFICKPQRFLLSGENSVSISSSMATTDTYTGKYISFNVGRNARITKLATEMPIAQNNNGYSSQWAGGAGKNLFDKDNPNIGNLYFNSSGLTFWSSANTRTIWIPCKSNTTYTVSKAVGARFAIGCSEAEPTVNGALIAAIGNNSAASLTITTGATAAYLCVYIWHTSDTLTVEEILATIQIEESESATAWVPYQNVATFTTYTTASVANTGENMIIGVTNSTNSSYGVTFTFSNGNHVRIMGTATANANSSTKYWLGSSTGGSLKLQQGESVTMSITGVAANAVIVFWRLGTSSAVGSSTFQNGKATFTATEDCEINSFYFQVRAGLTVDVEGDIQISLDRDAAYEKPNGVVYSGNWGSSLGGVYEAAVDAVAKTVTTRYAAVRFSDLSWSAYQSGGHYIFRSAATDIPDNKLEVAPVCSTYVSPEWGKIAANLANGEIIFGVNAGATQHRLYVRDDRFTTAEDFLAEMGDTLVIYELETPRTVAVTMDSFEQIEGENIVLGSGENVTAEVSTPATLNNPTRFPARPLLTVSSAGTLVVNNVTITITEAPVTIDCEMMDCYYGATNMNSKVTFSNYEFPELEPGANGFSFSGNLDSVMITPRWWTV